MRPAHANTGEPVIEAHNHVSTEQEYAVLHALKQKIDFIEGRS